MTYGKKLREIARALGDMGHSSEHVMELITARLGVSVDRATLGYWLVHDDYPEPPVYGEELGTCKREALAAWSDEIARHQVCPRCGHTLLGLLLVFVGFAQACAPEGPTILCGALACDGVRVAKVCLEGEDPDGLLRLQGYWRTPDVLCELDLETEIDAPGRYCEVGP